MMNRTNSGSLSQKCHHSAFKFVHDSNALNIIFHAVILTIRLPSSQLSEISASETHGHDVGCAMPSIRNKLVLTFLALQHRVSPF